MKIPPNIQQKKPPPKGRAPSSVLKQFQQLGSLAFVELFQFFIFTPGAFLIAAYQVIDRQGKSYISFGRGERFGFLMEFYGFLPITQLSVCESNLNIGIRFVGLNSNDIYCNSQYLS